MTPKKRTTPDISTDSILHKKAIESNEDCLTSWFYNVEDRFKNKTREQIKETLKETSFPYAILCEQWTNDFNIASCMRNANAFNASELYYIGNKKIDRRGMQGSYNYKEIQWLSTMEEVYALKNKYKFVAIDNLEGAIPLDQHEWEPNTLMIFGCEGVGITDHMRSISDKTVYIPQFGSVRSLNAAVASGIIMNDYVTKYMKGK